MKKKQPFFITTPIYYVNDDPHIGHAYTTLACDALARFKRLDGYDVKFLTGTDEHGQKVEKSAYKAGVDPQGFTDKVSKNFRDLAKKMNFSHDDFIRTTEPRHKIACQNIWKKLIDAGEIYLGSYSGWYSVRDEAFYSEAELTTNKNGEKEAPTGADVEWLEEPSYFFRLSAWQERLLIFYEKNPNFILPITRRNEVISFVKGGLQDLSVSRTSFKWGIKVPGDDDHIMYVWLDALTNYITAIGYPDMDNEEYQKFWPADVHVVGKDILRFHAVYWPAFLMAASLEPPKRIFAHGWWTNEGEKISKSLGNVIDPLELMNTYGLDQMRYFLLREVPFGNDGDFSHSAMISRINGELANDFGNLTQRVLSMISKNCDNLVPNQGEFTKEDTYFLNRIDELLFTVREAMDIQAFHTALELIWAEIRNSNHYIDQQAPWKLKKENPERMETVLYILAEAIRQLAIITQPFVPEAANKMLDQVGVGKSDRDFTQYGIKGRLNVGSKLPKPEGIFPRYIDNFET
ncbi:MAG: methionine--tRNA ligase [Pseudomonadota bacterium]|nr:methionine--tRNA ligase [Pseudomonadota bacterium]